jgi:hypothetical protein
MTYTEAHNATADQPIRSLITWNTFENTYGVLLDRPVMPGLFYTEDPDELREAVSLLNSGTSHHANRSYGTEFTNTGAKIGETINIRKPIRYIGRDGNA